MVMVIVIVVILFVIILLLLTTLLTLTLLDPQIDAVITYVDDSDPEWQKDFNKFSDKQGNNNYRWTNTNELKYCIKCIYNNACFFRNIFLVVAKDSQVPVWITEYPKVKIIKHIDIYEDPDLLPVFNSMSIEANLHKIKGLSENWVYFNDDVFINQKITKQEFIKDNKLVIRTEKGKITPKGNPTDSDIDFNKAWRNTNKLLDFSITPEEREYIQHTPQIQNTTIHRELINLFPDNFQNTISSRFRNNSCNLMNAGLAEYYSIAKGIAVKINPTSDYIQVFISNNLSRNNKIFDFLRKNKKNYKFINIQNNIEGTDESATKQLVYFLESYFV